MTTETFLAYLGTALGVIGIVVGVVVSYYFYRKSIRIKEPVYSIKSNNLISGSVSTLENLNITYKDFKVENLTVSKVLFYNRGAETISRQAIETLKPLAIASVDTTILDASILQVNNLSNNVQVRYEKSNENVYIDFDYLDQNQGAVIQVIHTGLSSEEITVYGDIMGVPEIVHIAPEKFISAKERNRERTAASISLLIVVGLILLGGLIYSRWFAKAMESRVIPIMLGLILGGTIAFLGDFFYIGAMFRRRFSLGLITPEGLEKFLE